MRVRVFLFLLAVAARALRVLLQVASTRRAAMAFLARLAELNSKRALEVESDAAAPAMAAGAPVELAAGESAGAQSSGEGGGVLAEGLEDYEIVENEEDSPVLVVQSELGKRLPQASKTQTLRDNTRA